MGLRGQDQAWEGASAMGPAPSCWSVEGAFYPYKDRGLPSQAGILRSRVSPRQRPRCLPSERDHGDFSPKRPKVLPSGTRVSPPQTDIGELLSHRMRATSRDRARAPLLRQCSRGVSPGTVTRVILHRKSEGPLLRQGPGHLLQPGTRVTSLSRKDLGPPS